MEFAARGGLDDAEFAWGDEFTPSGQHMANTWQGEFPWRNFETDGLTAPRPSVRIRPNGYGLFDMAGNVWEWTTDWYAPRHEADAAKPCCMPTTRGGAGIDTSYDPGQPRVRIPRKVVKGGSFLCAPSYCRRYRPAARQPEMIDSAQSLLRISLHPTPSVREKRNDRRCHFGSARTRRAREQPGPDGDIGGQSARHADYNRRRNCGRGVIAGGGITLWAARAQPTKEKPNVVFILADNVGYGDLGPYGGGELAGRADAAHRPARARRAAADPVPGRARLHAIARGADDRAIFDPRRPVADHHSRHAQHALGHAYTMGDMFHGSAMPPRSSASGISACDPQSLPTAHGFDEFYGIPPDISWDSATYVGHDHAHPLDRRAACGAVAKGPQIVEATLGRSVARRQALHPGGARRDRR